MFFIKLLCMFHKAMPLSWMVYLRHESLDKMNLKGLYLKKMFLDKMNLKGLYMKKMFLCTYSILAITLKVQSRNIQNKTS